MLTMPSCHKFLKGWSPNQCICTPALEEITLLGHLLNKLGHLPKS